MEIDKYLVSFFSGTKGPSLDAMAYFMEELGHPENELNVIHIAGTNGKGSIVEMLCNILEKAGYRVGKFMSPHLVYYQERICINHKNIAEEEMEALLLELAPKVERYNQMHVSPITLFELETTLAILYFKRNDCDFVVMETGLGGLYDCTNIVNSSISLISSIGYDHMNILGNTLEEIAFQKAGIIKENSDTVFVKQEEEVNRVIREACEEKGNRLHMIEPEDITKIVYGSELTKFDYKENHDIAIALKGPKQLQNAVICLECVEILKSRKYAISENAIRDGLQSVVHKGRFEVLSTNPTIIFDGAHNKPAIKHLRHTIQLYYEKVKKVFVISILQTKDYVKILEEILQEDAVFIFTSGNDEGKYVAKETLYEVANKMTNSKRLEQYELGEAIRLVKEEYSDFVVFVIGSFYVYGTVIKEVGEKGNDTGEAFEF